MSIDVPSSSSIDTDFCDLLLIMILSLVGDGGHNTREIITGFLSTIIIIKYLIESIIYELQIFFHNKEGLKYNEKLLRKYINNSDKRHTFGDMFMLNSLYKFVIDELNICKDDSIQERNKIFIDSIYVYTDWQPFIDKMYDETRHINIIHITKDQIDAYNPNILLSVENKKILS